jgi:uncharacterized protein (DUF169 family)
MVEYDWSIYDRKWYGYPPRKQGEILIRELRLYGDPIALAWWPHKTMPPKLRKHIYEGPIRLVHCQFIQRARFRGEIYILDGVSSRPDPPVCNGDAYVGLAPVFDNLMSGMGNARTDPDGGGDAALRIYGSPIAARRNLLHDYKIVPPDIEYLGIAPLSDCPFDPDVVVIIGDPRQATMACRALQYYSGITPKSETGPGTCSSSWAAAFLLGEPRYTLGCHGVFSIMGIDPSEICLSIPGEMMPTLCQNLELWRERGKPMFREDPPNEEREYARAPYDAEYTKDDCKKSGYVPWDERLKTPYEGWAERRRRKGLHIPPPE